MHIQRLLVLVLLGLSLSAVAGFTTITEAYEVAVSDLRLPLNERGTLTFRQCVDCEAQTVRVTHGTRFVINGHSVKLKDFRKSLSRVSNRADESVIVLHHLESNTVTSVSVNF
ncbi:MAG: hypothetical protein O6944_04955 [Gammaproteobacteria bacterium]|nr:hypothetical protein [Gammaproteobacteria bacterium]